MIQGMPHSPTAALFAFRRKLKKGLKRCSLLTHDQFSSLNVEFNDIKTSLKVSSPYSIIHSSQHVAAAVNEIEQRLSRAHKNIAFVSEELSTLYCLLIRIKEALDQLSETGLYTRYDILQLQLKLREIEDEHMRNSIFVIKNLRAGAASGQAILRSLMEKSYKKIRNMLISTEAIDPALRKVYNKLDRIRRKLEVYSATRKFTADDLMALRKKLYKISSDRVDNIFQSKSGNKEAVLKGQAILTGLLEQNYEIVQDLTASMELIVNCGPWMNLYEVLVKLKKELEIIYKQQKFVVDPQELTYYQTALLKIDKHFKKRKEIELRIFGQGLIAEENSSNGNETNNEVNRKNNSSSSLGSSSSTSEERLADENNAAIDMESQDRAQVHYMLHKCYGIVYELLSLAEPVDDSLKHVQNQLLSLRRCFRELKNTYKKYTPSSSCNQGNNSLTGSSKSNSIMFCSQSDESCSCDALKVSDIFPYKMQLHQIETKKVNGQFVDKEGNIPAFGQATLESLFNECSDCLEELIDIAQAEEKKTSAATSVSSSKSGGVLENSANKGNIFTAWIGKSKTLPVVPLAAIKSTSTDVDTQKTLSKA